MSRKHYWEPTSYNGIRGKIDVFAGAFNTEFRERTGYAKGSPQGDYFEEEVFPKFEAFQRFHDAWYIEPMRRPVDSMNLKSATKEALPVYRVIMKMITSNPLVTDADLERLDFPPRPSGTRRLAETSKELVRYGVRIAGPQYVFIDFHGDGMTRGGKPEGQQEMELAGAIFPGAHADVTHAELTMHFSSTKSPLNITFSDSDQGKRFYFSMRWVNSRGKRGPWTSIAYLVIP
ncbi:MAG: hypothetical protein LBG30_04810 [Odoribacteraceae bacterium]|nr:hypothetical protein [Odoribacteraceae bacterium]